MANANATTRYLNDNTDRVRLAEADHGMQDSECSDKRNRCAFRRFAAGDDGSVQSLSSNRLAAGSSLVGNSAVGQDGRRW
jgi:hypothetical protein